MSHLLPAVQQHGLAIASSEVGDAIEVKLSGSSDSQTTTALGRFLDGLHVEALRVRAKTVILDCESFYFMNSASVKVFVTWLAKIKAVPPAERYAVILRTNPRLSWQQRTFDAIRRSAPEIVRLDR